MKYVRSFLCLTALVFFVSLSPAQQQHQRDLQLKRVTQNFPNTEIYFQARCDSVPYYPDDKASLHLEENGIVIQDIVLKCPDPSKRSSSSVALVFNESYHMRSNNGIDGSRTGGIIFINSMDSLLDEASIIAFNENVRVLTPFTSNKQELHDGLWRMSGSGERAVWDALYKGVYDVIHSGKQQQKAVIIATIGADNASTRTPEEIVWLANEHQVRIFTILLKGEDADLSEIALATGGKFYHESSPDDMPKDYPDARDLILSQFRECMAMYRTPCGTDSMRAVTITMNPLCDSVLSAGTKYSLRLVRSRDTVEICPATSTTLEAIGGLDRYNWSNGATTRSITVSVSVAYTLTAADTNNCTYRSRPVYVKFFPAPTPTLIQSRDSLYIKQEYSRYQWYRGASYIPGATNRGYSANISGSYKAVVWDKCGTEGESEILYMRIPRTELVLERILPNPPSTDLYFYIRCGESPAPTIDRSNLHLTENGAEIQDFTVECADTNAHCPSSTALIFDASGSMGWGNSSGQQGAISAGHAFIDAMDASLDDVTLLYFNQTVHLLAPFSSDKQVLHHAMNQLPASGPTAAWDGAFQGLNDMIQFGKNPCRMVILLTDGADNSSLRTPDDIIKLARMNHIRVFTIGLGSSVDAAELDRVARQTGAKFYNAPSPGQLAAIYNEVQRKSFKHFEERCMLSYTPGCGGDSIHAVTLTSRSSCDTTMSASATYIMPSESDFIFAPDSIMICRGDSASMEAMEGFVRYSWSNGSTSRAIRVGESGEYFVTAFDTSGCPHKSTVKHVFVNPLPRPTILRANDTLSTQAFSKYQWYRNDTLITGATQRWYKTFSSGNFKVVVTNEFGCSGEASVMTSIEHERAAADRFEVFPDPTTGAVTLQISVLRAGTIELRVSDILGRQVLAKKEFAAPGSYSSRLDLSQLPPGMYFLYAKMQDRAWSRKLTVISEQ